MLQRAVTGQLYNAPENLLELRPSVNHPGARLPWFAGQAAGVLDVGDVGRAHRLEVQLGVLPSGLKVVVEAGGTRAEAWVPYSKERQVLEL